MKKLTAVLVALMLGLTALTTPAAAASTDQATTTTEPSQMEPNSWFDFTTAACVSSSSVSGFQVASGRNGGGTKEWVAPGRCSTRDADSVWISSRHSCTGYLNDTRYARGQWVNTAWWRVIRARYAGLSC